MQAGIYMQVAYVFRAPPWTAAHRISSLQTSSRRAPRPAPMARAPPVLSRAAAAVCTEVVVAALPSWVVFIHTLIRVRFIISRGLRNYHEQSNRVIMLVYYKSI